MYELYNRAIVHCDLKPGNILVSPKGHLAIADFGISMIADEFSDADKPFDECKFFSHGGTYAYQAPELLISHRAAPFTCAVDMWSLGVIIFEMYTSKVRLACHLSPLDAETSAVFSDSSRPMPLTLGMRFGPGIYRLLFARRSMINSHRTW